MKTAVYLMEQPFDSRNYDRFGVDAWLARGWRVEVWDLTAWAYPKVWKGFFERGRQLQAFPGYFTISSRTELFKRLSDAGPIECLIDLTEDTYCNLWAKVMLVRGGTRRVIRSTVGISPGVLDLQKPSIRARLRRAIEAGASEPFKRLAAAAYRKLAARSYAPRFIVVNGESSIPGDYDRHKSEIIRAHHQDYDVYLALLKSPSVSSDDFAVFIDQNYCFHPDFVYSEEKSCVTPEKYFPTLRRGFKILSEKLGIPVRVAAHPHCSDIDTYRSYFVPFPVEHGRTAELIRAGRAAICHQSIAVNFAVLFEKPLIFVTTNEFLGTSHGKCIEDLAASLGKTAINLDMDLSRVDWDRELRVDHAKYAQYIKTFIKLPGSGQIPAWDIVANRLEEDQKDRKLIASYSS
jgi:hypothetical protein